MQLLQSYHYLSKKQLLFLHSGSSVPFYAEEFPIPYSNKMQTELPDSNQNHASVEYELLQCMRLYQNQQHNATHDKIHQVQPYRQIFQYFYKLFPNQNFPNQQLHRHLEQHDRPYILLSNELQYQLPIQKDDTKLELQKCYQ